jgi:hypothetical protein
MKPLFINLDYLNAKSTDKLPCRCYQCENTFLAIKKNIAQELKYNRGRIKFCSFNCSRKFLSNKIIIKCTNCAKNFEKKVVTLNKSGNNFCSSSCAATYNNTHKTFGIRRSKLEKWLENKLKFLYPNLEILFNNKEIINSELDIYVPSLKLAFELNGIFHYEPIFGENKLNQIQNNDNRKFQACLEEGIELCIIDTSQLKYFKEKNLKQYLDIINNIIFIRLLNI